MFLTTLGDVCEAFSRGLSMKEFYEEVKETTNVVVLSAYKLERAKKFGFDMPAEYVGEITDLKAHFARLTKKRDLERNKAKILLMRRAKESTQR